MKYAPIPIVVAKAKGSLGSKSSTNALLMKKKTTDKNIAKNKVIENDEIVDKDNIVNDIVDITLKLNDVEIVDNISNKLIDKIDDEIIISETKVSDDKIIEKNIVNEEKIEDSMKWANEVLLNKHNNSQYEILEPIHNETNDITKVDLKTCLNAFTRNEKIEVAKNNGYKCPACTLKNGIYL